MAGNKDEKKVFDVSKPSETKPSATSKPVIVGHKPLIGDPMVKKDEPKEDENAIPINVMMDGEEPSDKPSVKESADENISENVAKPDKDVAKVAVGAKTRALKPSKELTDSVEEGKETGENSATNNELKSSLPEEEKTDTTVDNEAQPTQQDEASDDQAGDDDSEKEAEDDKPGNNAAVGAVLGDPQSNRAAELAEIEKQEKIAKLLEDDNYKLKINKTTPAHGKGKKGGPVLFLLVMLITVFLAGYALVDAGFFGQDIKLPYDFIKNQSTSEVDSTTQPTQKVTPPPVQNTTKSNFTDSKSKLTFSYPSTWKLTEDKTGQAAQEGYKSAKLVSPSGKLSVIYVSYIDGIGFGGCVAEGSTCPTVIVKKVEELKGLSTSTQKVYYIEKITTTDNQNYNVEFGIWSSDPENSIATPKVGTTTTQDDILLIWQKPSFTAFGTNFDSGENGTNFKSLKEAEAFFASEEYKQAKEIVLSLKPTQ